MEIVKILFNEQSYEYYKFNLKNKEYKIIQIVTEIIKNPYVNIDYISLIDNENILSYTLKTKNSRDISSHLFNISNILPESFDIIKDIFNARLFGNFKEVIKSCDTKYLINNEEIYNNILNLTNVRTSDKLEMIELLFDKISLIGIKNLINITINHNMSRDILDIFSRDLDTINLSSFNDVRLCLKMRKVSELKILFTFNKNLIYPNNSLENPFFMYLIESDNDEEINVLRMLDVLLESGLNKELYDEIDETVLIKAIKNGREKTVEKLLFANVDLYHLDINGYSGLHHAILTENINLIKLLFNKNQFLINEATSSNLYPIHLVAELNDPINILKVIMENDKLDYQVRDINGDTLIHYYLSKKISVHYKIKLCSMLLNSGINLLEPSKLEMKPAVIRAVEDDLYELVILIMNKLLEIGDIQIKTTSPFTDIESLLKINNNIIVKNQSGANFYPLVALYIENNMGKKSYSTKRLVNLTNFLVIYIIFFLTFKLLKDYNFMIHYYLLNEL